MAIVTLNQVLLPLRNQIATTTEAGAATTTSSLLPLRKQVTTATTTTEPVSKVNTSLIREFVKTIFSMEK